MIFNLRDYDTHDFIKFITINSLEELRTIFQDYEITICFDENIIWVKQWDY